MSMENQDVLNTHRIPRTTIDGMERKPELQLLNKLIAKNLSLSNLFETASNHMKHEENEALLKSYAAQYATFVKELSNLVISHGGKSVTTPENSNLLRRAWVTLKASFTADDGDILIEMAESAGNILEAYGEVISQNINDDTRSLIRKQMSETRLVYQKLYALGTAYLDS